MLDPRSTLLAALGCTAIQSRDDPADQLRRLTDQLSRVGVISELVEFAECNHEFDSVPSYAATIVARIDVFLRRVLHERTLAAEISRYSMFG